MLMLEEQVSHEAIPSIASLAAWESKQILMTGFEI